MAGKRRVGLALSGGAACGFAHVGAIEALLAAGIEIKEVAGTSMGAIVAAYYALHGEVESLGRFARGLDRRWALRYLDPTVPTRSLLRGEKFRALLEGWFGEGRIEEARIPLAITATDLRTGEARIFREGAVVERLLASSAIPGLLPVRKIGREYLIDGGIALFTPVAALRTRAPKVAVEIPVAVKRPPRFGEEPYLSDVLTLTYGMQLERSQREPEPRGTVTIRPRTGSFRNFLDFHRSGEYLREGRRAAERALPRILGHGRPKR